MKKKTKFVKYFKEYQWSNIFAMIRNNRLDPKTWKGEFKGKLVVITGATSGIGYFTAHKYASMGSKLLCINRSLERSEALKEEIEGKYGVTCDFKIADLSKLKDIHRVAAELAGLDTPLDVIIHNAGVYLTKRVLTGDKLEKVFVVQYLSSFIINHILMDKLKSQEKARIILVNSEGHRFAAWGLKLDDLNWEKRRYTGLKSYGSAKLAQLLSMLVFSEHFKGSGVTINAMHPGAVKTETGQDNGPLYLWYKKNVLDRSLKSPEISAEALYYLGASDDIDNVSGKFFNLTTEEEPAPPALDSEVAYRLWELSREIGRLISKHS
ncbi:MAG: SDR family NAD(P)-dependent oxidoreductase [Bacteroidales bacterium]|jgi:NAD(P)-dependent dehydrogenase (short-subunit alcohol dehydrogenase family)|nr:SDR family NAD(P)-dependent oxidoreductase [Bacteroidales bacterium]